MKISFDYDSTLTKPNIFQLAKSMINLGIDVWICTSRPEIVPHNHWNNDEVYETASKLGIPKEKIIFTGYQDKAFFLDDFNFHYDDDNDEIDMLKTINSKCIGIWLNSK